MEQLTSAEEETNTDFTGTKVQILTPVIVEQLTSAEEETSGHNLIPGCEGAFKRCNRATLQQSCNRAVAILAICSAASVMKDDG